ncbi:MAG: 50S ribosomal protein L29 [Chloroflexi bacterium]|nr:50S ribosomal protein L29 [Chloroflexota bacterium]MCL5074963.1 50S ribosomal protein L29 [Chloroflexota bacterium]
MKAKEIRELSQAELRMKLDEAHKELFNLRFQMATRQKANYARLPELRKIIARIKTIMHERERP